MSPYLICFSFKCWRRLAPPDRLKAVSTTQQPCQSSKTHICQTTIPVARAHGKKSLQASASSAQSTVICGCEAGERYSDVPVVEVSSSLLSGGEGGRWRSWEHSKKPGKTINHSGEATPEGPSSKARSVDGIADEGRGDTGA